MRGFEIDEKAFRAQNVGRPPQHLIREAIQNAFDEKPAHVTVTVEAADRGVKISVVDDGPGFKDEKEIWTIYASGKRDDATKRGRLGRGLKELISVASRSEIATAGKIIRFGWYGGTLRRKTKIAETKGTAITAVIRSWKKSDIPEIINYLRLFVPPEGVTLSINGVVAERPKVAHVLNSCCIETVIYNAAGVPTTPFRHTSLTLYEVGGDHWIYEMGIPVEKIPESDGFEWSIDVGQRTPLRPERDMLPRLFVHSLYAHVANHLLDKLPTAEMTDLWMEEAVAHFQFDSKKEKLYCEKRFGSNAARAVVSDAHDRNLRATEDGVNVVQVAHVSAGIRDILRRQLPSTADMYPMAPAEAKYLTEEEWTAGEKRFVHFGRWLAMELALPEPRIIVIEAPDASCVEADSADYGTRIRVNRSAHDVSFFNQPKLANWLPLIVHELAHRTGNGHDHIFWAEVERLHGEAAGLLVERVFLQTDALFQFGL